MGVHLAAHRCRNRLHHHCNTGYFFVFALFSKGELPQSFRFMSLPCFIYIHFGGHSSEKIKFRVYFFLMLPILKSPRQRSLIYLLLRLMRSADVLSCVSLQIASISQASTLLIFVFNLFSQSFTLLLFQSGLCQYQVRSCAGLAPQSLSAACLTSQVFDCPVTEVIHWVQSPPPPPPKQITLNFTIVL